MTIHAPISKSKGPDQMSLETNGFFMLFIVSCSGNEVLHMIFILILSVTRKNCYCYTKLVASKKNSQQKGYHAQFIPSSLNPISPISISPEFFAVLPFQTLPFSNFAQYLSCPVAVLPNFIFGHFSIRPEAIFPNFPISPSDHFVLFQQGLFPFCPNAIFQISGPKTNKKFSNKLIPQFWTLFLGLLWPAHIIGGQHIGYIVFLLSMWIFLQQCLFLGVFRDLVLGIREILVIFE